MASAIDSPSLASTGVERISLLQATSTGAHPLRSYRSDATLQIAAIRGTSPIILHLRLPLFTPAAADSFSMSSAYNRLRPYQHLPINLFTSHQPLVRLYLFTVLAQLVCPYSAIKVCFAIARVGGSTVKAHPAALAQFSIYPSHRCILTIHLLPFYIALSDDNDHEPAP